MGSGRVLSASPRLLVTDFQDSFPLEFVLLPRCVRMQRVVNKKKRKAGPRKEAKAWSSLPFHWGPSKRGGRSNNNKKNLEGVAKTIKRRSGR